MNKKMLESKMKLFGDTGATLAEALGIARGTLSAKMNGTNGAEFTQREIAIIVKRYNLTPFEIKEIFFTNYVS